MYIGDFDHTSLSPAILFRLLALADKVQISGSYGGGEGASPPKQRPISANTNFAFYSSLMLMERRTASFSGKEMAQFTVTETCTCSCKPRIRYTFTILSLPNLKS